MKKLAIMLSVVLMFGLLVGCGTKNEKTDAPKGNNSAANQNQDGKLQDGTYYAQEKNFSEKSGWKYAMIIKVYGGKIVDVNWTGAHINAGPDKKTVSKNGDYGMVEFGGAQAEWHEQAALMEQYLIEKQDPAAIDVKEDGKIDAISGVSIGVNEFKALAISALAAGPAEPGPYKDGAYHAEAAEFAEKSGWKETVDVTVIHGNIAAANWNAVHKDGGLDKKASSIEGIYGMKEGGAQAEWHEQAAAAEAFLLEKQDLSAFGIKDDGKTDAVSGVSITVSGFTKLVEQALAGAK